MFNCPLGRYTSELFWNLAIPDIYALIVNASVLIDGGLHLLAILSIQGLAIRLLMISLWWDSLTEFEWALEYNECTIHEHVKGISRGVILRDVLSRGGMQVSTTENTAIYINILQSTKAVITAVTEILVVNYISFVNRFYIDLFLLVFNVTLELRDLGV